MTQSAGSRRVLFMLLAIAAALLGLIVAPLAGALFAAAVVAVVASPMHAALADRLGGRNRFAAAAVTGGLALVVLLPVSWLGLTVLQQLTRGVTQVVTVVQDEGVDGLVADLPEALQPLARRLQSWLPEGALPPDETLPPAEIVDPADPGAEPATDPGRDAGAGGQAGKDAGNSVGDAPATDARQDQAGDSDREARSARAGWLLGTAVTVLRGLLSGFAGFLFDVGLLVVAVYFLLAEGRSFVKWIVSTAPLPDDQVRQFVDEFRDVTVAVFLSTVLTAGLQAVLGGIGYLLAGVSYLAPLTMVTFVAAFIPAVGGGLIVVGTGAVMMAAGHFGWGLFLVIWGIGPVGLCDNLVKPLLAQRRLRLPGSVLFFSMIGGLLVFGVMGVVAGPLIVSFFLVVVRALGTLKQSEEGAAAGA